MSAPATAPFFRLAAISSIIATSAFALKYAAPEHQLQVDPSIPSWKPGELTVAPEEDLNLVGADVMDEITLGWVKIFRKAYPRLSVTMEARASGTGGPALTEGRAHLAPVGRELLPAEEKAFVEKFGYKPLAIRVATGSLGSLGKTATVVIFVDKNNPIQGLTMAQLDAIYSKTRLRGHPEVKTWGDLGLRGEWAKRPIHLYGLKPVNGIEQFLKGVLLQGGEYRDGIEFVKSKGFSHAFTVAAEDMAQRPGGMTYALLANVT
ncbi:MAG TPA: substrate-binding domain-containing protein, partial [Candidatus Acidoferrales bacterium]|nr:substrate-binding domain-containing protein [Candidatus Acidoferrales bacterium]